MHYRCQSRSVLICKHLHSSHFEGAQCTCRGNEATWILQPDFQSRLRKAVGTDRYSLKDYQTPQREDSLSTSKSECRHWHLQVAVSWDLYVQRYVIIALVSFCKLQTINSYHWVWRPYQCGLAVLEMLKWIQYLRRSFDKPLWGLNWTSMLSHNGRSAFPDSDGRSCMLIAKGTQEDVEKHMLTKAVPVYPDLACEKCLAEKGSEISLKWRI